MIAFVLGTIAVLVFLGLGTYSTARLLRRVVVTQNLLLLPAENLFRLVLIAVCLFLGNISGLPYAILGWAAPDLWRAVFIGLGIGLCVAAVLPLLTQIAVRVFGQNVYSPVVVRSILPRSRREWVLVPLALVSSVFLEELLFRSYLLGGFQQFAPPVALAVVASVAFGAMHLPQGSLGVVVATLLGLLLSGLFLLTSSLLVPFIAHYVINLVQLIWASLDKSLLESYARSSSGDADAGSYT